MSWQYALEHAGTVVAAISGAMAGRGKQVDLFGVVVLALVTALGGGTLRDVILDARPVYWVADSNFVLTTTATSLLVFFVARSWQLPHKALLTADAAALALFTVIGVEKALDVGVSAVVAVALGVVTGTAGGMVRDVLTGEIPLVFRRQTYLYATASLCGAVVFALLRPVLDAAVLRLAAAGATFFLRLAAIWWKIHLPEFEAKEREPTGRP
jgi:uncharacterized membrane protein YeiH